MRGLRTSRADSQAFRECGYTLHNAYVPLSLLALVVIPELRISDMGIVDVRTFEVVGLVANII